jgi:hypothetical protein
MFARSFSSRVALTTLIAGVTLAGSSVAAGAQAAAPAGAPGGEWMHRDMSQMAVNRFFDKYDPDRTGRVTRAAYLTDARNTFDRIDMNKDGKLERSEVELYALRMRMHMHHGGGRRMGHDGMGMRGGYAPGGPGMGPGPGNGGRDLALNGGPPPAPAPGAPAARPSGAGRNGQPHGPRGPMSEIPHDKNGDISLEAYLHYAGGKFDEIDTHHTGVITVPDYRTYVRARMEKMRAAMSQRRAQWMQRRTAPGIRPAPSPAPQAPQ